MRARVTVKGRTAWTIARGRPLGAAAGKRRGTGPTPDAVSRFVADPRIHVDEVIEATPRANGRRSDDDTAVIDVTVDRAANERTLVLVRHQSRALTFHAPDERTIGTARRGVDRAATSGSDRFLIPVRDTSARGAATTSKRRGIASKVVKIIVLKVTAAAADALLPALVLRFERRSWKHRKLAEGFVRVDASSLRAGRLRRGGPATNRGERSLLLLHGTFSHTASAFAALADGDFFERVAPLYGDRVFGFNHFSLARTPEENAAALLAALPAGTSHLFDVITHSRGGLVLRNLVERRRRFGALAKRFQLGHAVLVAAPNDGTPLATPRRWQETVGWIANLLEIFPDNPLTFAPEWISEAIVWLAQRAVGGIPGLSSMDARGKLIAELQAPPGPPVTSYSALASNFEADDALVARLLDVGVDGFFNVANDLVVPTEGGWRVDRDGMAHVAAERIGCFGPGGNLAGKESAAVHHLNFFVRRETVDFLVNALAGLRQRLPAVDPVRPLPDRRFFRAIRDESAAQGPR